jgi:hypothetical protein
MLDIRNARLVIYCLLHWYYSFVCIKKIFQNGTCFSLSDTKWHFQSWRQWYRDVMLRNKCFIWYRVVWLLVIYFSIFSLERVVILKVLPHHTVCIVILIKKNLYYWITFCTSSSYFHWKGTLLPTLRGNKSCKTYNFRISL